MMRKSSICVQLLVMAFLAVQTHGFSFILKPVGSTKVTVTPGELITYNAHLGISDTTPLSFHVSLPYFQTPIMNVERIEVIGVGKNLQIWNEAVISHSQYDKNSLKSRSQSSMDFGNVNWTAIENGTAMGNDVVVQVQSRLLEHANVTAGTVFWLYFGMQYQNDSVWVIGKSVKATLQPGPSNIGVTLKIPTGHFLLISNFELEIDIYHLPDSKSKASELSITLSIPSYLTSPVVKANGPSPAFTLSSSGFTITFSEEFEVGQRAQLSVKMTYSGTDKGKFVNGNIYGSYQFKTATHETSENCLKTVDKNVQMAFKLYAKADCDVKLTLASSIVVEASSAFLPCCKAPYSMRPDQKLNWEPWRDIAGRGLADEFIQMNFQTSKRKLQRIVTQGSAEKKQFVRSFKLSYSNNGVHWKYVTHMGKTKVFQANVNAVDKVINVFPEPLETWFLRVHVLERSPAGAGIKILLYGCSIVGVDPKTYEAYQRGFIAATGILILCNVHPDRMEAKPNCYQSLDDGLKWDAIHPSVVNVIGYDATTGKVYGLGVTSSNTPLYMEIVSVQSVRVIPQADWDAVKSGVTLPTVIPLYPVHGDAFYEVPDTSVTVGSITYAGSPEGLLLINGARKRLIASWTEYAA